jgi:phage/plasmid-associated DNA primase
MTFKSIGAALLDRGYRIIPIPHGKKGPVFDEWEKTIADPSHLDKWTRPYVKSDDPALKGQTGYAHGNVGILTERTPAVDLDILDGGFACEMESYVSSLAGDAPVRVGRAPKRLLVFRTEAPFTKVTSAFYVSPDGAKHRVEVLGTGQQFVGYGTHPDTKKPYEWISFDDLRDIHVDDLPSLSREQAHEIVSEFERRAALRGWTLQGSRSSSRTAPFDATDDDFTVGFKQPLLLTDQEIRAALFDLKDFEDYEAWNKTGMALYHQFGGDESGFDLWDEWSQQGGNYAYDALRSRWDGSYKATLTDGRSPTTFASLLQKAKVLRKQHAAEQVGMLRARVAEATSEAELMRDIVSEIAHAELSNYDIEVLVKQMQTRLKKLSGAAVSPRVITKAIADAKGERSVARAEELEMVLAARVLQQHYAKGSRVKNISDTWWVYQEGYWRREDATIIRRAVLETLVRLKREDSDEMRKLLGDIEESRGDRLDALCSTIFSVLRTLVAQSSESDPLNLRAFQAPRVMNCTNGELWFADDGEMTYKDHDPRHNLTAQLATEYDVFGECPTFSNALHVVFQEAADPPEVIRHFCEVMGYLLQPTRDAAMWMMFKGPGSNGKTFLMDIVSSLMGPKSVIAVSLAEIGKNANAHFQDSLVGKLMLYDDDLRTNTLLPDDWLKKLSERKLMTANPKGLKTFEFIGRAIPVILTNTWPSTSDMSEGLQRRIIAFEADHKLLPGEKSPLHRITILRDELPGVLNLFIAGFQRFLRRGSVFSVPAECLSARERLMSNANALVRFKTQMLIADADNDVAVSDVYSCYMEWMRHWEYAGQPLGRNKFYNAVESLGVLRVNHSGVSKYKGHRLAVVEGVGDPFTVLDETGDGL